MFPPASCPLPPPGAGHSALLPLHVCQGNIVTAHTSSTTQLSLQVVQEYERAVIFRLGRLVKGGAKGPGIFFIIPCIDSYKKVDLRTVSFDVPPQEVSCGTHIIS